MKQVLFCNTVDKYGQIGRIAVNSFNSKIPGMNMSKIKRIELLDNIHVCFNIQPLNKIVKKSNKKK